MPNRFTGERLGPYLPVNVLPIARPEQVAATITWLPSRDDDWVAS